MARRKKYKKTEDENNEEKEKAERKPRTSLKSDVKRSVAAVLLFALSLISVLAFFSAAGAFGEILNKAISLSVGWVKFILPIFLIISGIVLLFRKETSFYVIRLAGLFTALLGLSGFFHWFVAAEKMAKTAAKGQGGGYLGYGLDYFLEKYLGHAGSLVIILVLVIVGLIVAFDFSLMHFISKLREKKEKIEGEAEAAEIKQEDNKPEEKIAPEQASLVQEEVKIENKMPKDESEINIKNIEFIGDDKEENNLQENYGQSDYSRNLALSRRSIDSGHLARSRKNKGTRWIFPPTDLLEQSQGKPQAGDVDKNFSIIEKTLKDFGIDVERGLAKTGPSVTQYSFRPAVGVKISKIMALQNDLSLALAAHPIRIEAPIPGQSLIGIEVPNKVPLVVRLRDMIEKREFRNRETNLTIVLGEDVSGNPIFADLSKMPHLLVAGATGTGKSIAINSIITSLLYQNSPEDLNFIMIDPKRVELSLYNGIPHLITDTVVENGKVVNVLKWAVGEMERRYRLLQDSGSRDIISYRKKMLEGFKIKRTDPETKEKNEEELKNLPYIVIIVDELADLMGSHGKEVEGAIVRIAQMARAVGMHLVVSTQRPSVEVITGLIKANITTRIAFQVATQIDSRTIIDMSGAEKLLGNGDMLYLSAVSPKPKRIQGTFVSESEVKRVVKFIARQKKKEESEESADITENAQREILEYKGTDLGEDDDSLLEQAKVEIKRAKKASASLLQRRLRIGYSRAARILDILEEKGIIGPADGAKPREVYGLSGEGDINYEDNVNDQEKRDKWEI